MTDIVLRFFIGGLIVSVFSLISDLLKPKTFAGLFGAAPSVALATLANPAAGVALAIQKVAKRVQNDLHRS